MRPFRVYVAGFVFGATVVAAAWLYTYRVWTLAEYIGRNGRPYHPAERISVQPWWSVPATVVALLAGAAASVSLLPQRERLIRSVTDRFAGS